MLTKISASTISEYNINNEERSGISTGHPTTLPPEYIENTSKAIQISRNAF